MNEYQLQQKGTEIKVTVNCNCEFMAYALALAMKDFLDPFKLVPRELPEGLC